MTENLVTTALFVAGGATFMMFGAVGVLVGVAFLGLAVWRRCG